VDAYLRGVNNDPVTVWFTDLLREKSTELEQEKERADRIAGALRAWHRAASGRIVDGSISQADLKLIDFVRDMGINEP
jgi:hypothetical protein